MLPPLPYEAARPWGRRAVGSEIESGARVRAWSFAFASGPSDAGWWTLVEHTKRRYETTSWSSGPPVPRAERVRSCGMCADEAQDHDE